MMTAPPAVSSITSTRLWFSTTVASAEPALHHPNRVTSEWHSALPGLRRAMAASDSTGRSAYQDSAPWIQTSQHVHQAHVIGGCGQTQRPWSWHSLRHDSLPRGDASPQAPHHHHGGPADPVHGTSYGRLRPFCSRQRIFSTSAFTFAFSALAVSLVYGGGCWAPSTEPSSNTRRKEVSSPFPMKV